MNSIADPRRHDLLALSILDRRVLFRTDDADTRRLLKGNFGGFAECDSSLPPDLEYSIAWQGRDHYILRSGAGELARINEDADLLYSIEQHLTVELQKKRSDLFFLHSAAVEWQGRTFLLAAESGSGKSTTTWALLHHGFGYLSDELSPVDLQTFCVQPYPHALCLKRPPPRPYELPDNAIVLDPTTHIPVDACEGKKLATASPLAGIFLILYSPKRARPRLTRLSQAQAAARLYVTALNALAHADFGLDPVIRLVQHVPCFEILTAGLPESCQLIQSVANQATGNRSWNC